MSPFFSRRKREPEQPRPEDPIDYESLLPLDTQELSKCGIAEAYAEVMPHLAEWVADPWEIEELIDDVIGSYSIRANGQVVLVWGPETRPPDGWGRAGWVLFTLVNSQLEHAPVRLYALSGGQELCGVILTPEDAEIARQALPHRQTWPYLPTDEPDWFGQPH